MTLEEVHENSLSSYVYVEANEMEKMSQLLRKTKAEVTAKKSGLEVRKLDSREIGHLAHDNNIVIYELKKVQPTLEQFFTEITDGKVDYVGGETNG